MKSDSRASGRRNGASSRGDGNHRISKFTKAGPSETSRKAAARYLTHDEQSRQFVADEDKFVLKQSKKKADIRVREGRAKPIDFLAFNLRFIDLERDPFDDDEADDKIEVPPPSKIIQSLTTAAQLAELESDIQSYYVLETDRRNRQFWEALRTLCVDQKAKFDPQAHEGRVVSSVASDIDKILAPKSYEQLEALEKQIKAKLRSNEDIDTDYWEQLLRSLKASDAQQTEETTAAATGQGDDQSNPSKAVAAGGVEDVSQATMALYHREAARGISENEEIFTAEEAMPVSAKPRWNRRGPTRKPRYFNRVQMGYEWNKYNQTHYDHENPPPKVVQGYKFNIFYPDLIDKTKAPTFKIIREHGRRRGESFAAAGEQDTCLICFIAGAPYDDIAFRIVDREWDYSAKRERGFRSSFDKGILQLHFQFKKIFYRK
ncbi:Uncharacterized protein ESCO_002436 [Escovopsis weberi]|uniref:Splicing factor Cactin n=1 Tax=Escovopsis weberi TaxID=150374 RepID=A0A0M9VSF0_ESCWE|nr:Uncharacterized protein ESCO_002436 [Escovopsis weberi]